MIGGKAKGLFWLEGHGFQVPRWWVTSIDTGGVWKTYLLGATSDKFAVRSSAEVEDGENHSFAGMFNTELNIDLEDVEEAISRVCQVPERAREYARTLGLPELPDQIPVVIMEMVDAKYSGVTIVQGSQVITEAVEGIGESLVSGESTPIDLPPLESTTLTYQARKIKALYGRDIDIEWAIDQTGNLWYLQVRPLTAPILLDKRRHYEVDR